MSTAIGIISKTKDVFWGRTNDLTFNPFSLNTQISVIPRKYQMRGQCFSWETNYQFMGINYNNSNLFYDGINECGLAGAAQTLEACTWASASELKRRKLRPLVGEEIVAWILSKFSSVRQIAKYIVDYGLIDMKYAPWSQISTGLSSPLPLKYVFIDKTGESIILEPVNEGAFKVYLNTINISTDSPSFDWHLLNLRNYLGLSGVTNQDLLSKQVLNKIMYERSPYGLPGDYSSASRFIRSVFLTSFSEEFDNKIGINQLYRLSQSMILPEGIKKKSKYSFISKSTAYWVGYDLKHSTMYILPKDTLTFSSVNLWTMPRHIASSYDISHQQQVNEILPITATIAEEDII